MDKQSAPMPQYAPSGPPPPSYQGPSQGYMQQPQYQQYPPQQAQYAAYPPQPVSPYIATTAVTFIPAQHACANGHVINESFTVCGWLWLIFCFPVGLLCCLTMKDRRCMRCGGRF